MPLLSKTSPPEEFAGTGLRSFLSLGLQPVINVASVNVKISFIALLRLVDILRFWMPKVIQIFVILPLLSSYAYAPERPH